ncbi:DNA-directed RNA polymerase sigma-70 factor [Paraliobacillus quinghaiensis]|uniref:DNA-directed RNA polymerase sigma-70 factor n=1 Tax=Paraliobacillus quinghaiensis TaxID=470815 RepID=A0A917TIZ7_9BACI|nr:DNA-directed RNA polymerase sigma-70 factor [Paraliobacillus quinghaiensis]
MKKAQKGNEKAFLKLFQEYETDIYRMAFVYVKNKHDALDVVQEVAYRSFKTIHTLREPAYCKTWLMKITINCAIDLIKRNKKIVPIKADYEAFMGVVDADIPLALTLEDLIDDLKEDEKSVVLLRFYHDLSFKEIAETLDIPLGTAKSILYRSLRKLRSAYVKGDEVHE